MTAAYSSKPPALAKKIGGLLIGSVSVSVFILFDYILACIFSIIF
jgi:hypothetical protein